MDEAQYLSDLAAAARTIREASVRRDELIVAARKSGAGWAEIASAAELSRSVVNHRAMVANDGKLPMPPKPERKLDREAEVLAWLESN